jgi:hypothetical protein
MNIRTCCKTLVYLSKCIQLNNLQKLSGKDKMTLIDAGPPNPGDIRKSLRDNDLQANTRIFTYRGWGAGWMRRVNVYTSRAIQGGSVSVHKSAESLSNFAKI